MQSSRRSSPPRTRARRREGIGELLTRSLLDRAAALGATEMRLEVIVENQPAIRLYEKLGFVRTRELEVLALERGDSDEAADEVPFDIARGLVRARRESGGTVAALRRDTRPPRRA
jgi:ribosomal protein S18 acetylase RimI-like enzyme